MAGDYNLPPGVVDWIKFDDDLFPVIATGRDKNETDIGQKREKASALFDVAKTYLLEQVVSIPTRRQNVIDLVFTNMTCNHVITTEDDIISDHKLVACELDIDVPKNQIHRHITCFQHHIWIQNN